MSAAPRPAVPLLLEGVEAGYGRRPVLHGASARLEYGRAAAVVGANGTGKSTLVKVVLGLLPASGGRVEVFGRPPGHLDRRRWQLGYVPQVRDVDRAFPASVFDLALMGRTGRLGLGRWPGARDRALVREKLAQVGLAELAGRPFGTLSGGQQQRAFLARALSQEPDLLVLDEPVAGVDAASRGQIGRLLEALRADGLPLLVVTHDIREIEPFVFDEQWRLEAGRVILEAPGAGPPGESADHHHAAPAGRPAGGAG